MSSRPVRPRLDPLPTTPGATNVTGLLAHAGEVGRAFQALGAAFHNGPLPPRERELIVLRTAWRTGNRYAFGRHRAHGVTAGLTPEEVDAVTDPNAPWDAASAAVLAAVDEICADDCVSEAVWAVLTTTHDNEQVTQVLLLVGYHRQLAGLLNSVGAQLEAGLRAWD